MWGREDWCEICLVYIDGLLDLSLSEVHCTCVYIEERKKKSYLIIISWNHQLV